MSSASISGRTNNEHNVSNELFVGNIFQSFVAAANVNVQNQILPQKSHNSRYLLDNLKDESGQHEQKFNCKNVTPTLFNKWKFTAF